MPPAKPPWRLPIYYAGGRDVITIWKVIATIKQTGGQYIPTF